MSLRFSGIVKIASYLMLLFFLASVAAMIIRWLQVLSYRGKLGEGKFYYKNRKRLRIALITLGASCTLFVLVSGMGILAITSIMSRGTEKLVQSSNSMFSRGNNSSNATMTNSTDSPRNKSRPDTFAETSLISDNTTVDGTETNTRGGHKITGQTRQGTKGSSDSEFRGDGDNDTENTENATEEPIPEDKQHCRNQTAYPRAKDRQQCRIEGLEKVASSFFKKKFVTAAFLAISFIGHLINTCTALCCNGDPADPEEEGYEMAAENECDGETGKE
ncbi:hypothetical protein ACHWQZ_G008006 [Mnemiopsis leidyi]